MNGDRIARPERGDDRAFNRRTTLRALAAGVVGIVALRLQQPDVARAAEDLFASVADGAKKKKDCGNQVQACKRSAARYCANVYIPDVFGQCTQDLYFCCNKAKTCKFQNAKQCLRNSPWTL